MLKYALTACKGLTLSRTPAQICTGDNVCNNRVIMGRQGHSREAQVWGPSLLEFVLGKVVSGQFSTDHLNMSLKKFLHHGRRYLAI